MSVLLVHPNLPEAEPYEAADEDIVKVLKARGWVPAPAAEKTEPGAATETGTPPSTDPTTATGGRSTRTKGSEA
jgi:hypothetical protein